jgi:hypothetical protein
LLFIKNIVATLVRAKSTLRAFPGLSMGGGMVGLLPAAAEEPPQAKRRGFRKEERERECPKGGERVSFAKSTSSSLLLSLSLPLEKPFIKAFKEKSLNPDFES